MNEAIKYLTERIEEDRERLAHNPNHRISNGVSLMLELEPLVPIETILKRCWRTIHLKLVKDNEQTMLTAASAALGRSVLMLHEAEIWPTDEANLDVRLEIVQIHLALGDLILESFYNCKYIDFTYIHDVGYYIIPGEIEPDNEALLSREDTLDQPIDDVTSMFQGNKRPLIKRKRRDAQLPSLDTPFIQATNCAQQQGWKVNKKVLTVLQTNQELLTQPYIPQDDSDAEDLRQRQQASKIREFNAILSIADRLKDLPSFYQYIEFDYRGRMYINQSYFNFQGSDYARGMLLFDREKPVTQKGLAWLARHTACSFNQSYSISDIPSWCSADYHAHLVAEGLDSISVDKFTMADRERWTYENMDLILSTAREKQLWDCEKPISFLACAFEWEKYDLNPEHFWSALPIPIDGSNNGWQHLAAISKDPAAGKLVGLVPVEIQEDFYVKTAKALIDIMPDWFEERQIPMKKIRKGISKRGSMTRAYSAGAGKIGENMWLDCRQAGMHDDYNITEKDCTILAKNLILAINGVCTGPLETMHYLQKLAMIELDTVKKPYVNWYTPAGFHSEFKAPDKKKRRVKNTIRNFGRINHVVWIDTPWADKQKYLTGISPNFIHSLDAAHMCSVMSRWDRAFGGVHDSFSTHADDVDDLQQLTKEVFIEMYADDDNYLGLANRILTNNPGITIPGSGTLDINEVTNSDYFFA